MQYIFSQDAIGPLLWGGSRALGCPPFFSVHLRPALARFLGCCCNRLLYPRDEKIEMTMDPQEPPILLDDLAGNCPQAWDRASGPLYNAVHGVLRKCLLPGLGVDPENVAADIIALEIYPGLRDRRDSFAKIHDFEHLLNLAKRIARLRAIDTIRKAKRRGESALPEGWEDLLCHPTNEGGDDGGDSLDRFFALIFRLKPPKPDLFIDHFIGELKYEEIARKHGLSLGTVCSHFSRGFKQIRDFLSDQSDPDACNE
jgi:hypothetical protein